jgi:cobalt-zinc-cadmium efflux system membrane fusion protein
MTRLLPRLRAALIAILLTAGSAVAHEGHDHTDQTKTAPPTGSSPRVEAVSGPFELVALLQKGELVIYLDRFETNAPIVGALVTVETPGGPVTASAQEGTYRLAAPWAQTGSHALIFTVTADDLTEILTGMLHVAPGSLAPGESGAWSLLSPAMAQGLRNTLGSSGTALLAIIAFAAGLIAAMFLRPGRKTSFALAVSGMLLLASDFAQAHDGDGRSAGQATTQPTSEIAQRLSDGTLFVPKPTQRILAIRTALTQAATHRKTLELPGRIIPDPNASGFVQASVSGRLSPPTGGFPKLGTIVKAGDVLAFVTPPFQAIDVSDMRQKAGELDQQINIVERRIARYESLAKTGAVAKVTLDEAVLELKGLRERRAAIDKSRGESERLIAPVSGIIAAANSVSGQITETNAVVFQIIDPARLWVEALTFSLLPDAQPATARTGDGRKLTLAFQGAGLTDRSQAIPVHFAIEGDTKGLRVGELVTVLAPTGEETQGLAVPRTAVLRGANGQTILFEHTAAEHFEPRIVRVEPLDADRVLVLDGLAAGKRVVVQGPELLNQIR